MATNAIRRDRNQVLQGVEDRLHTDHMPDTEGQAGARYGNGNMLIEHWDAVEVSLTKTGL